MVYQEYKTINKCASFVTIISQKIIREIYVHFARVTFSGKKPQMKQIQ